MPFHQSDQIKYFTFASLSDVPVKQAVFTRRGGVSRAPWASLNMGLTVGDDPAAVMRNRQLAFAALGRDEATLSDSWLVHGREVVVYDRPRTQDIPPKADIVLTDCPEVSLFMRYADCTPILLVDPVQRAIGLAHAGWKGTVLKVAQAAVESMTARYGTRPENVLAAIGPAIGPEKYEVGEDVVDAVREAFGADAPGLLPTVGSSTHFDLWQANRVVLEQAGVRQIELSGLCTATHTEDWYSHRAEDGKTGRFGVLLALED
ncbi:peptidoglycan editing factor PgeF [bacterium]|nr:peptidoglycan editing factor PgeF [bacterium]MCB2179033.1 peptidoglycan editing factor PgeF [bacterium]